MTTTADWTARAAAQLREAARDVARVAELRSRRAELLPGSTQHGASVAVPLQPDNLMGLMAARLTAAGFDVREEDGDGGSQLDIGCAGAPLPLTSTGAASPSSTACVSSRAITTQPNTPVGKSCGP